MRRRIEVVEGVPCACVAKTDRERVADEWRVTCRACGVAWWWGLVEVAEARTVAKHGRGRVRRRTGELRRGVGPRGPLPAPAAGGTGTAWGSIPHRQKRGRAEGQEGVEGLWIWICDRFSGGFWLTFWRPASEHRHSRFPAVTARVPSSRALAARTLRETDPLHVAGVENHIVAASVGQARRTVFKLLREQLDDDDKTGSSSPNRSTRAMSSTARRRRGCLCWRAGRRKRRGSCGAIGRSAMNRARGKRPAAPTCTTRSGSPRASRAFPCGPS